MKITNYSSAIVGNPWKNWLFIRLETDSGIHGFGEASLNGFPQTVESAISELQQYFIGQSPFQIIKIVHDMLTEVYSDGGQIHRGAISAIESACWDILGKSTEQPLWNLWGGQIRDEIRLYANGWYQTELDPEAFAEKAKEAISIGYTALKFDPFGETRGYSKPSELKHSLDIIKAVRDAIPSEVDLMIEGHCRFDVTNALKLTYDLADIGVVWFEEPVSFRNLDGLIEIAKRSPVPIATGENFTTFGEFVVICSESRNFIIQPDVLNIGGLRAARQVCEFGETLEILVAPHDSQGPLSKAMCLQLAAISSAVFIQEDFEEFNPEWTRSIASTIDKSNGQAKIPHKPGLGRSLNWEILSNHPYDSDATLTLFQAGWEQRKGSSSKL